MPPTPRIVVVESTAFTETVVDVLTEAVDLSVTTWAGACPAEAVSGGDGQRPNCVVTDDELPETDAAAVATAGREAGVATVVVSERAYGDLGGDPLAAGASAFHRGTPAEPEGDLLVARVRRAAESALERNRQSAVSDTLFADPQKAITLLDTGGRLVDWNDRACEFFDLTGEADPYGKPLWETAWCAQSSASVEEMRSALKHVREGNELVTDLTVRDQDGNRIEVQNVVSPVFDGDTVVALVGRAADVTEQRSQERRLQVLSRVLRHNLRNDVDAIGGHAELLSAADDDGVRSHAAKIRAIGDRLAHKADLARAVEGALSTAHEPRHTVDVRDIVAVELARLEADCPDAVVEFDEPEPEHVSVRDGISVAFRTLFENAVAHNPSSTPHLSVAVEHVATPASDAPSYLPEETVRVAITDDGPGIPDHEVTVLDEGIETKLEHSNGLGLWAANWIVVDSSGTLSFDRPASGGTRVTVTLPAAEAA